MPFEKEPTPISEPGESKPQEAPDSKEELQGEQPAEVSRGEYGLAPEEAVDEAQAQEIGESAPQKTEIDPALEKLVELDPGYKLNGADYAASYLSDLHVEAAHELEDLRNEAGVNPQAITDTNAALVEIAKRLGEEGVIKDRDAEMLSGVQSSTEVKLNRTISALELLIKGEEDLKRKQELQAIWADVSDIKQRFEAKRLHEAENWQQRIEASPQSSQEQNLQKEERKDLEPEQNPQPPTEEKTASHEEEAGQTRQEVIREETSEPKTAAEATAKLISEVREFFRQVRTDGQKILKATGRENAGPFLQALAETSALYINGSQRAFKALRGWLEKRLSTPKGEKISRLQQIVEIAENEAEAQDKQEQASNIHGLNETLQQRIEEERQTRQEFLDAPEQLQTVPETISNSTTQEGVFEPEIQTSGQETNQEGVITSPEQFQNEIAQLKVRYEHLGTRAEQLQAEIKAIEGELKNQQRQWQKEHKSSLAKRLSERFFFGKQKALEKEATRQREARDSIEKLMAGRKEELQRKLEELRSIGSQMKEIELRFDQQPEEIKKAALFEKSQWGVWRKFKSRFTKKGRQELKQHKKKMKGYGGGIFGGGVLGEARNASKKTRGGADILLRIADELAGDDQFVVRL